ncbi:DUF4143 domain-containing protein [uncultured Corynebacterium sp.]|uniref:ATP-binding protein n=1 Tax=uncultured Corynebacterium sp. TaxID=159447 RepID=UPI0025FD7572|nr:DUF4143 domain-containing protein [uncultured Corynebacterium sp.]
MLIEGPKGCGKSATSRQVAGSLVQVDTDFNLETQLNTMPDLALDGATPRVFDEWQEEPRLWNLVRHEIDRRQVPGQFILTGSTAPGEEQSRHSGAGRIARLRMHTFSFYESGHSNGAVSLSKLVEESELTHNSETVLDIRGVIDRMAHGGWPGNRHFSTAAAQENLRSYAETVAHVDINVTDGRRRDPVKVQALLRSLARGVATEQSISAIATDIDIDRATTREYLTALQRIFIAEEQRAWSSHLRSRASLRKVPKRHLADPALAAAVLEASPDKLLQNLEYSGQMFESQVVHDLRVLTGRQIFHARDASGLEVDAVFESAGRTVLVEVKLGQSSQVLDRAAQNLQAFADRFAWDTPPLLLIVTGGNLSVRLPSGVFVTSLTHLAP